MARDLKPTQLTRTGYEYQDLICIGMIIDWYNDPNKYEWIRIEGELEHGTLKGLDDIICMKRDGSYDLVQVKFTINPSREDLPLSFDWMLEKKKQGTSMLQKWAADVLKYSATGHLANASLRTNRIPDQAFKDALKGNRIDYEKLPETAKERIDTQLGGSKNAKTFCSIFNFEHSEQHIENYESKLHDQLVPAHTSEAGFHRLRSAIRQSATRKNFPFPDGSWRLSDIEELLRTSIHQKLSQDFSIPTNYLPPSHSFHVDLLSKATTPGCYVISGQPGMGKSTYLSYLNGELVRGGTVVIRHHYWLGSNSIIDRISSEHALKSMMFQLHEIFPKLVQHEQIMEMKFDECVRAIASFLRGKKKTLVIIVDGLDHVHRDRPDTSQLHHLVNRIMPLKDEVCLFFGTQPIDENLLPPSLTNAAPQNAWINLPPMDTASIKAWLKGLYESSEFILNVSEDQVERELNKISGALVAKTMGYPLHLIYAVRELLSKERRLSAYRVDEIMPCPNGDIREYYQSLWNGLGAGPRDILLLIACAQFPWPDKGNLSKCYTDVLGFQEAFSLIHHLIEQRQSGIHPFHGSLAVFLRATDTFKTMSASLMARVKNWLDDGAPEYWQWGWKWLTEASLGNPKAILEGVSKDWAVHSVSQGYSIDHIDYIIAQGENYALKGGLYSELVRLRSIRIRVVNGPEYQIQDYPLFLKCALTLQNDDYPYLLKLDNLRYLPDEELRIISSLSKASANDVCKLCFFEVRRRINLAMELKDGGIKNLIDIALSILSHMPTPDYDILSNFFDRLRDPQKYIVRYFQELLENGNAETVIEVASCDFFSVFSNETKELLAWACLIAEINHDDRSDLTQLKNAKVAQLYKALTSTKPSTEKTPLPESENNILNYYDYFFFEICQELSFETETVELVGIPRRDDNAFNFAVKTALKYLAQTVVQEINTKGTFSTVYFFQTWDAIDIPSWHQSDHTIYDQITSLKRHINEISVDLFILSHRTKFAEEFTDSTIDELLEVSAFSSQLWLSHLASKSCQEFLTTTTAKHWFNKLYSELRERNDNIGTLANDALDLCDLACRFHCESEARKLLELTCMHMLGHGSRKDITFHDLYQAIEHCAEAGVGYLPNWLRRLSAPTNGAFEFTEKEIGHLPEWYFNLTGRCAFERLPFELEYHLEQQNWNNVDHILVSFVKFTDASSRADNALLKCLVSRKPILELEKRASNSAELKRIYDEQIEFVGSLYSDNAPARSESSLPPQQTKLKFCDYPPEKIRDFERSLKDEQVYSYDEIVSSWIKYWCDAGKALQIVSAIDGIANDFVERGRGFERNIGEVFDLSLNLQGKKTAYKWAIRDVKFNQLWSAYSGRASTKKLKKYSRIYKNKWQDFLQLTLAPGDRNSRFSLWNLAPTDDLVAFLIEAEQCDEATAVTEMLLTGFETGIQHLKLPAEYLPAVIDKSDSVSARMLLSYFFIPDKIARLKTAKEISSLLLYDGSYHYMYLEKLSTLVYEADICDFLSILSLGNASPFREDELRSNIKYPSVLSEYILSTLGFRTQFTKQMYSEFSSAELKHSQMMEKSKNGLPKIWEMRLHELSQNHGLSLNLQMAAEWEVLTKRKQFLYFNHTDFINDKYYSHDEVNCSLSSNCEAAIVSAYLRTIGYCFAIGILDNSNLIEYIIPALPFSMPFSSLNPDRRPNFWPTYKDIHSSETNLSDFSLQHFLDEWLLPDEVPLFASGPIFMDERGLEADLECIIVAKDHVLDQQELNELFSHKSQPEDGIIVAKTFNWPIGRWQTDLYMRGFSVPTFKIGTQNHSTKTFGNKVVFSFDDRQIAQWRFWYEEWFPARSKELRSNIAVVTSCVVNDLEIIANAVDCDLVLALRLKVSKAHPSYNEQKNGEYFASKKIYTRKEKIEL